MKNIYTIIFIFVVFLIIITGLYYIDIPSPSKLIKEPYQLEVK